MNVVPMKSFYGNELTSKLQELADENYHYYQLSDEGNKRYVLSASKQKKTPESELSKAFWHFFSLHEASFTSEHIPSLLSIHKNLSERNIIII